MSKIDNTQPRPPHVFRFYDTFIRLSMEYGLSEDEMEEVINAYGDYVFDKSETSLNEREAKVFAYIRHLYDAREAYRSVYGSANQFDNLYNDGKPFFFKDKEGYVVSVKK